MVPQPWRGSVVIITSTPLRVSFLGGGTDYPDHFSKHGGATLGTSIDRSTFITVTPLTRFFDHKIRISYSFLLTAAFSKFVKSR